MGMLIFDYPATGTSHADARDVSERLSRGETVVVGRRALTWGGRVPYGTKVAFTPGFLDAYGVGSPEYRQACARDARFRFPENAFEEPVLPAP